MFLFNSDYFLLRISVAGGLADYLSEFLVQFYYLPWLGAAVLSALLVALQLAIWLLMRQEQSSRPSAIGFYALSFVPSAMTLWLLGDECVLLSYVVALLLTILSAWASHRCMDDGMGEKWKIVAELLIVPVLYWLLGAMVWLYALLRVVQRWHSGLGWRSLWLVGYVPVVILTAYVSVLSQWPLSDVFGGLNYYRIPMHSIVLMYIIPLVVVLLLLLSRGKTSFIARAGAWMFIPLFVCLAVTPLFYDTDKYEMIRQDYLVRNGQWDEITSRAADYQVETAFSSNCVNLALAMKGQLADRMFDFWQSGEDALFMPRVRDLTSNLPTAEAFWQLGMVNSAQRYMFDIQESILNFRKSGRCTKRIAECLIVNGKYQVAAKYLDQLRQTLFYRSWAEEATQCLGREEKVNSHPEWSRVRQLRYQDDFLYNYGEIDKMMGLLFTNNPRNKMALDYFMGELLLKGKVQEFQQYMSWVQQYGGYPSMPVGYRDAMMCIEKHGDLPGSSYGRYVRRMTNPQ